MDWAVQKPFVHFIIFALALFGPSYWMYIALIYIIYRILLSRHFYRIYTTLPRDISGLFLLIRVKLNIRKRLKANRPLHEIFLENVHRNANKEAIIEVDTGRRFTFEQFNVLTNQYANFFQDKGYKFDDVISLFMENSADFVALWLGLSKLGIISAWINSHLRLEPLAHSIRTANSKAIVTTSSLIPTLESAFEKGLLARCEVFVVDSIEDLPHGAISIRNEVQRSSTDEPNTPSSLTFRSILCYIYTSGTTGNPKPAVIKHFRFYWMAMGCGEAFGVLSSDRMYITLPMYHSQGGVVGIGQTIIRGCTSVVRRKFSASNFWKDCFKYDCTVSQYIGEICRFYWMAMGCGEAFGVLSSDRMYITLPMYHSQGGVVGIGQTIIRGCTSVVRRKFSASNFWKDCFKYDCTVSQYIGEICRYLLAQKEIPEEKLHRVRLMYGNGLRAEIWSEFVNRFNIAKIGELYGSTEGNSNIVNIDNRVGACGFFPIYPFISPLYPVRLLKIDEETGELLRGPNGLCIPCHPGETGEMVGVIKDNDILLRFEGYVSNEESNKKIIRNAIHEGDAVFCSGDVVHWDEFGYLYFKDRRGDTFRWKGENVSTTEVEGILQPMKMIADVTVYGVEVPKKEGRAGMAAVVPQNGVTSDHLLQEIATRVSESLPSYAIPVFLRLCVEADITGTFKLRKTNLQKEGFRLERCHGDPIFYWDSSSTIYSFVFLGTFKLRKTNLQKEGFRLERCHGDPIFYWDSSSTIYRSA
uniref:long-chain-fatty-acid--CoA ligase n=1 Tax=Ascaris lumbricoides TaxID=6252 RepID=A0A9J2PVS8_ASCLU